MQRTRGKVFAGMSPVARIRDYLLERRIRRMATACATAVQCGRYCRAREILREMTMAIGERSPAQHDRMARARGLLVDKRV